MGHYYAFFFIQQIFIKLLQSGQYIRFGGYRDELGLVFALGGGQGRVRVESQKQTTRAQSNPRE